MGKIFHSNENYEVRVNADTTAYDVINSFSGVVEFNTESLPEAIFAAENMNSVLVYRTYEWIAKSAAKKDAPSLAAVTDLQ